MREGAGGAKGCDVRRVIGTTVVFLLVGAVVNVAVAWGCAIQGWSRPVYLRFADGNYRGVRAGWVLTYQFSDMGSIFEVTSGWPMLAMNYRSPDGRRGADRTFFANDVTILVPEVFGPATFPLRPIWPGFAVNTLFYSVVLWLLICGPFVLRRFIRMKRGRCVKCGYDLRHGEHDVCPECGRLPAAR